MKKIIMDDYGKGLYDATRNMLNFCVRELNKINNSSAEPNSARQITNGGKISAYNKMIQRLQVKIDKYLAKEKL